jgi:hypothetical protein
MSMKLPAGSQQAYLGPVVTGNQSLRVYHAADALHTSQGGTRSRATGKSDEQSCEAIEKEIGRD